MNNPKSSPAAQPVPSSRHTQLLSTTLARWVLFYLNTKY